MKKILFIIALFAGFVANSQQLPGYTDISSRYRWLAGIFRAMGLPAGSGPAAFTAGQVQQAGAVYMDTLGTDAGLYIYINGVWQLQGTGTAVDLPNGRISGGEVVYSGTGYTFNITPALFRLNNEYVVSDSGSFTLSAADAGLNRIDRVYFDLIGAKFHILEGVPGLPALEPQVGGDQVGWSFISVPAGSVAPSIVVVYDENTGESTVTNVGTTTDPNNTASFFRGTKSTRITNINANDRIIYTAPLTWDLSDKTTFSFHVKLSAVLGTGNYIYVSFLVGSTRVSLEVLVPINRTNITTWQPISIQMTNFGTLQSSDITAVQYRYVGSAAVYPLLDIDYIFFQSGITQPAPPTANVFPNIIPPATWGVSGNGTQNITITAPGLRDKVLRGGGTAETDSSAKYIGTINSLTKSLNGFNINTLTNEIIGQEADPDDNGFLSAFDWRRFDTTANLSVENLDNTVDTLLTSITPFRSGIMGIKDSTGIGIHNNGRYLAFYSTVGGSQTLQQVFDTEPGGSVLTKEDTIDLNGNPLKFINGSNVPLHIAPDYFQSTTDDGAGGYSSLIHNSGGLLSQYSSGGGFGRIWMDLVTEPGLARFKLIADSINFDIDRATAIPISDSAGYRMMIMDLLTGTVRLAHWPTGGGSGGRFGVSGEDDTGAEPRLFTTTGDPFQIRGTSAIILQQGTPGSDSVNISVNNQHIVLDARDDILGIVYGVLDVGMDKLLFNHSSGNYEFTNLTEPPGSTNKMFVWDSITNKMHVTVIPAGGGGSGLFPTTGTGTATGAVTGSLAGNVLTVVQGSNTFLTIDPTSGNEISQLLAANTTGADNFAYFQAATNNTQGQFSMSSSFNGAATEAFITGTSDASSSILAYSATTHTFTGAVTGRWTPRVGSTTSSATPTINTDNVDIYKLTAQTADITSFTTNLSGTPVDGDILEIQITGTAARAITWGASFVASTVALPTTTVTTATLSVVFQYFTTSSYGNNKWVCVNNF